MASPVELPSLIFVAPFRAGRDVDALPGRAWRETAAAEHMPSQDVAQKLPRDDTMVLPLRYTPSVEMLEEDERKTQAELIETLLGISRTTLKDEHEALRAVHAKSHGLLSAVFVVAG